MSTYHIAVGANMDEFLKYLAKLDALITSADTSYVLIMGDYNSDFTKHENGNIPHDFGREVFCFCQEEGLMINDYELLSGSHVYTYHCDVH